MLLRIDRPESIASVTCIGNTRFVETRVGYRTECRRREVYGEPITLSEWRSMKNTSTIPSKPDQSKGVPPSYPHAPTTDANLTKERAEEAEVAGRHKNTSQKDHKGAR